jgi:hypothetical protein
VTKHVCPHCRGVLSGTRRVTLEIVIVHHEENCPAALKVKKAVQLKDPGTKEWGPEHAVTLPPRKRIVPRQR